MIYIYKCANCGKEDHVIKPLNQIDRVEGCLVCGTVMRRIIPSQGATQIFKAGYWEDMDVEPVHISSKKQLIEECKKRGLYATGYM